MASQDKGRDDKNNNAIYNGKGNQNGQAQITLKQKQRLKVSLIERRKAFMEDMCLVG